MIGLVLATLFVVNWGANYERQTVETQFSLSEEATSEADLEKLVADLLAVVQVTVDAPRDEAEAMHAISRSLQDLVVLRTEVEPTLPDKVKRLPKGFLILSGGAWTSCCDLSFAVR